MLRSAQVSVAIIALCAIGFGLFFYKLTVLNFPLAPNTSTIFWDVEAKISFQGRGEAAEVRITRAQETPYLAILDESYLAPSGFGVTRTRIGPEHFATFQRRDLDTRALVFYRATLVELDSAAAPDQETPEADDTYGGAARRAAAREEQTPFLFALDELISQAERRSADDEGFVSQLIESVADEDDDRVRALRAGGPRGLSEPARRLAVVLNAAGIPARRVEGLVLDASARDIAVRRWVEVWWDDEGWEPIQPLTGEGLPEERLLPLSINDRPLVQYSGVRDVYVSYAVERRPADAAAEALRRGDERAPLVAALSLLNLPVHTQDVFEVILLIPVGAAIIAFLRQVVGLTAFGTFMPVLIAISFRETSLITGLVLFVVIVAVGLGFRAYFNRLQLLIVPRLAAILSIVTMLMAIIALVGNAAGMPLGLSISLFPMVIITMTIERMSLVWDEAGAREAFIKAGGSLGAAILAYLVMTNDYVEHLAFTFPELLLVALAFMIAIGRYNGFKLTEYIRFRSLADDD